MDLLTTDLDRTLIYSSQSVHIPLNESICIEYIEDRPISYMNERLMNLLREADSHHYIVPVTSRSTKQFTRLQLPITPRYAIVANGGIILRDGRRDVAWDAFIATQLKTIAPKEEIEPLLANFERVMLHDELFFVCRNPALIVPEALKQTLLPLGWTAVQNGRKLYILPQFLTKERAVHYLRGQLAYARHLAAGDSVMDVPMMQLADIAFAPAGSEAAALLPAAASSLQGLPFAEAFILQMNEK